MFLLFSCSTSSVGVFEKRKHLKGWHFKKNNKFILGGGSIKNRKELKTSDRRLKIQNSNLAAESMSEVKDLKTLILKQESTLDTFEISSISLTKSPFFKIPQPNALSNNLNVSKKKETLVKAPLDLMPIASSTEKNHNYSVGNNEKRTTSKLWNYNNAFFLFFLTPMLFIGKKSREVQHWAAKNTAKSRSLLTGLKIGLAGTAVGLGYLTEAPLSQSHLLISASGIALSYGFWEYFKTQKTLNSFRKIALLSAVNTSTSFGFYTLGGMLSSAMQFSSWSFSNGLMQSATEVIENENLYSGIEIVFGILILTVFAAALITVISFLSCTLICSGIEAAGVMLLIVGVYFTLVFYIYLILKLFRKKGGGDVWSIPKTLLMTLFILSGLAALVFGIGLLGGAYG
ncbi:hypothetical protein DIT68_00925 [Brumimicrobium oceani]|uniref:Uncharacterized protein n=1 Tax=Brumimicrobium oceani TaxID=2100725 RepID=A0A2U2XGH9_9FLAO|nr:hypothetical protein DIT68_00925 [Brumimicrobium oceani]